MVPIDLSQGQKTRVALGQAMNGAPIFIKPALAPIWRALDAWIESVELRIEQLQGTAGVADWMRTTGSKEFPAPAPAAHPCKRCETPITHGLLCPVCATHCEGCDD